MRTDLRLLIPVVGAAAAFAISAPFSGLALATVLVIGCAVGAAVLALPWPPRGTRVWGSVPTRRMTPWLVWVGVFAVLEIATLWAADELSWPTLSAIQDPLTGHPVGRLLAGAVWVVAGVAVVTACAGSHRLRAGAVALGAAVGFGWSGWVLTHGAVLASRDAPTRPAPGVDNVPVAQWPVSALITIAAFAGLVLVAVELDRRARRGAQWPTLRQALAAATTTVPGRLVALGWWWWSGWHFLAR